jgi:hypothetical protein
MNTLSLKKRAWTELEALFEEYKTDLDCESHRKKTCRLDRESWQ